MLRFFGDRKTPQIITDTLKLTCRAARPANFLGAIACSLATCSTTKQKFTIGEWGPVVWGPLGGLESWDPWKLKDILWLRAFFHWGGMILGRGSVLLRWNGWVEGGWLGTGMKIHHKDHTCFLTSSWSISSWHPKIRKCGRLGRLTCKNVR